MTATHRPRIAQTVLGVPLYLYYNVDSIAVWLQDGGPLGVVLLEKGGYSVGYSLDATGKPLDVCLEQMIREREVCRV
jgi:hypothetical protein